MSEKLYQFAIPTEFSSVDAAKGIIYGVSLITSGLIAKGHDLEVDRTTLEQMLECAEAKKKVPVKWNHKTGADAVSGYLRNFRIEGRKLLGDWHLLKSHERFSHALELATEMPECLGLSASFRGDDEERGGRKYARCTDLVSADLVASPAANPDGFFEEKEPPVDTRAGSMAKQNDPAATPGDEKEFSLKDVMTGIQALQQGITDLTTRTSRLEEFQDALLEEVQEFEEGGQDEGEGGTTEFADGADAINYLEARLSEIQDAKASAAAEHAFSEVEGRVAQLVELNERLALENQAMAEVIHEFQSHTGRTVEFSAGADGGLTHEFTEASDGGRKRTDFEVRCTELERSGKSQTEAIQLAMKENPGRYTRHLQSLGVIRSL